MSVNSMTQVLKNQVRYRGCPLEVETFNGSIALSSVTTCKSNFDRYDTSQACQLFRVVAATQGAYALRHSLLD